MNGRANRAGLRGAGDPRGVVVDSIGTIRAELLGDLIRGLDERVAGDAAHLSLARRLEAADQRPPKP